MWSFETASNAGGGAECDPEIPYQIISPSRNHAPKIFGIFRVRPEENEEQEATRRRGDGPIPMVGILSYPIARSNNGHPDPRPWNESARNLGSFR